MTSQEQLQFIKELTNGTYSKKHAEVKEFSIEWEIEMRASLIEKFPTFAERIGYAFYEGYWYAISSMVRNPKIQSVVKEILKESGTGLDDENQL